MNPYGTNYIVRLNVNTDGPTILYGTNYIVRLNVNPDGPTILSDKM